MTIQLIDRIVADIGAEIDDLVLQVADSAAGDFADYRFRCGVIAGLRRAIAVAREFELKLLER